MSRVLKCVLKIGHLDALNPGQSQYRGLHTCLARLSSKDYYEIKLTPFTEQSAKGVEGWRRRKHLPQHVENAKWREDQGLPQYLNSCGPLTDNPDYSYVDETIVRPPPYGSGQRKRIIEQIDHAKTIVQFCKELDYGKEKYQNKLKAEQLQNDKLLQSKLKPKGTETL